MPDPRRAAVRARLLALTLAVTAALAGLGCVTLVPRLPAAFSPCRTPMPVRPLAFGPDFHARYQVSLRADGTERAALDAVIEKHGDRLVVVAFDRAGSRVFSAVQEGDSLRVEPAPGRRRPIAPEALLSDVALLRGVTTPQPGLEIVHDRTPSGAARSVLREADCRTEAVYVTVEDRPSSSGGMPGEPASGLAGNGGKARRQKRSRSPSRYQRKRTLRITYSPSSSRPIST